MAKCENSALCENSEFRTTVVEHIVECHRPGVELECMRN